jgi:hypothetical protein
MPETAVKTSVLEKFLRYVRMDTQSDESSTTYPARPSSWICCACWWRS